MSSILQTCLVSLLIPQYKGSSLQVVYFPPPGPPQGIQCLWGWGRSTVDEVGGITILSEDSMYRLATTLSPWWWLKHSFKTLVRFSELKLVSENSIYKATHSRVTDLRSTIISAYYLGSLTIIKCMHVAWHMEPWSVDLQLTIHHTFPPKLTHFLYTSWN